MEDGTCSDIEIDFQRRGKKLQELERDEVRAVEGVESGRGREGMIAVLLSHEFLKESYDWQSHACGVCVHTSHCTAADTHTHPCACLPHACSQWLHNRVCAAK